MEVRQISVFLENKAGQLAQICRILADAQIDMKALNIAETSDYGVLRLITDKPLKTLSVLTKNALVCTCSDVVAVKVPDQPGGLASVLEVIAQKGISIEYMYSMMSNHSPAVPSWCSRPPSPARSLPMPGSLSWMTAKWASTSRKQSVCIPGGTVDRQGRD